MNEISETASSDQKVVGIIPARFSSSRFPGKPLTIIRGKTLIRHVYEKATTASSLHELMVATDDVRIVREVEGFGGRVVLTSPGHTCGTERIAEAAERTDAGIVVNIQGDELLSDGAMIDECVAPLLSQSMPDAVTLAAPIRSEEDYGNPHVVKVVADLQGRALLFSRSPIPYTREFSRVSETGALLKHIGIYAYRRPFLLEFVALSQTPLERAESLEQLRILEHGKTLVVVLTSFCSMGVDVPSDRERAEQFLLSLTQART